MVFIWRFKILKLVLLLDWVTSGPIIAVNLKKSRIGRSPKGYAFEEYGPIAQLHSDKKLEAYVRAVSSKWQIVDILKMSNQSIGCGFPASTQTARPPRVCKSMLLILTLTEKASRSCGK